MYGSRDFNLVAGLLALSLAIGGAGINFPLLQLFLQGAALLLLGYFVATRRSWRFDTLSVIALVILALAALLPLLQLVPLPTSIWQRLPGRQLPTELDAALGWFVWRPWTLDVEGTIRSWLVLLPPAAIFVGCLFVGASERARLIWVIVAFALANALLGMIQLVSGGWLTPYPSAHLGFPLGVFVNRNHEAAFLLAAMPLCGAMGASQLLRGRAPTPVFILTLCVVAMFALVVLGTTSRMGLALLPIAAAAALLVLFRRTTPWRVGLPAIAALGLLTVYVFANGGFARTLSRFSELDDPRFAFWTDVEWALRHYGLAGTGVGTFVPVYQTAESLEAVTATITNHAHNDYLEILLESGVFGAALLIAFVLLVGVAIVRAAKSSRSGERAVTGAAAGASIALLLLFSIVDYPLRMPAVSAVLAVLCAILLPARGRAPNNSRHTAVRQHGPFTSRGYWLQRSPAILAIVGAFVLAIQAGLSAKAISAQRFDEAVWWAPWSTKAHEQRASTALLQMRLANAQADAHAAIRLSPINASAVRTLGLIRLNGDGGGAGDQVMAIAAALGWREPVTQLWTIDASLRSGEPDKAVQRAEALFQQNKLVPAALRLLFQAPTFAPVSRLVTAKLAQRPQWRQEVLHSIGELPASEFNRSQDVLFRLNRSKSPPNPEEIKPMLQALISNGRTDDAQRLWVLLHPALIANGNFNSLRADQSAAMPAAWEVSSQNRQVVTVATPESGPRNRALRVEPTNWVTIVFQDTMLPAGSYTISYRAREMGPSSVALSWQLNCRGTRDKQIVQSRLHGKRGWQSLAGEFVVPSRDCLSQRLVLKRLEANDQSETWLDDVQIQRHNR